MRILLVLVMAFLWQKSAQAQILPTIFYRPPLEQKAFCESTTRASDWYRLMARQISAHPKVLNSHGLKKDVMRNLLVTWSYSEFLRLAQAQKNLGLQSVGVMGHVYANASHHLGRLVRFKYWDQLPQMTTRETIKESDRGMVSGGLLGRAVETMPELLSYRLMKHSLDLYETLSWVLGSAMLCGSQYTLKLVEDYQFSSWENCDILPGLEGLALQLQALEHLKGALRVIQSKRILGRAQLQEFASAFVMFEQFYLQHTMYNQLDVRLSASLGLLDRMRFIPFDGVKSLSFKDWCESQAKCWGSSINLAARVRFDQIVIGQEIFQTMGDLTRMSQKPGHRMIQQVRQELFK